MRRSVSLVKPSASYSTMPLEQMVYEWGGEISERSEGRPLCSRVDSRSKVAEESSDVLPPLVVSLDHILHLQGVGGGAVFKKALST